MHLRFPHLEKASYVSLVGTVHLGRVILGVRMDLPRKYKLASQQSSSFAYSLTPHLFALPQLDGDPTDPAFCGPGSHPSSVAYVTRDLWQNVSHVWHKQKMPTPHGCCKSKGKTNPSTTLIFQKPAYLFLPILDSQISPLSIPFIIQMDSTPLPTKKIPPSLGACMCVCVVCMFGVGVRLAGSSRILFLGLEKKNVMIFTWHVWQHFFKRYTTFLGRGAKPMLHIWGRWDMWTFWEGNQHHRLWPLYSQRIPGSVGHPSLLLSWRREVSCFLGNRRTSFHGKSSQKNWVKAE